MIFGMARRLAAHLPERLDVVQGDRRGAKLLVLLVHRLDLGQVQHRPQQHRSVAVRQDEAVAVRPDRVLGVEIHDPVPQRVGQGRQRHRRPGMPRLGFLDGIDGQCPDRVDRELVELVGHGRSLLWRLSDSTHQVGIEISKLGEIGPLSLQKMRIHCAVVSVAARGASGREAGLSRQAAEFYAPSAGRVDEQYRYIGRCGTERDVWTGAPTPRASAGAPTSRHRLRFGSRYRARKPAPPRG